MNAAPFLVLMSLLQQTQQTSPAASATVEEVSSEESSEEDSAEDSAEDSIFTFRLALEAGPLSLPSGTQGGGRTSSRSPYPWRA